MNRLVSNSLMLVTALIWGTTFVAQQVGMQNVGPLTYTGARFLIGAAFVLPLALREWGQLQKTSAAIHRTDIAAWSGLGVLLFLGAVLQQVGVAHTSVSNAGFLTALYVPLVPLFAWIVDRHRPHFSVWPASLGTLLGTYYLSGGALSEFNAGDWWVIASTLFWAAHVLFVGRVASHKGLPILVAFTQFVVCGILASILALANEVVALENVAPAMPAILYGGLLSVGIAFTLQVIAQRHTRPADAAVLLSSEILFSAIAAALYLGERITTMQMVGGAIIFSCVVLVQILPLFYFPRD